MVKIDICIEALKKAKEDLSSLIIEAKQIYLDDQSNFVEENIGVLVEGLNIYATLFKTASVADHQELLKLVKENGHQIQNAAEELMEVEEDYGAFLSDVQSSVKQPDVSSYLNENQTIPLDLMLQPVKVDIDGEGTTSLQEAVSGNKYTLLVLNRHFAWLPWRIHIQDLTKRKEELSSLGLDVVVITFGGMNGAKMWLQETNCIFPYYTDEQRNLYKLFSLKKSVIAVWGPRTLQYYGSKIAANAPLPKTHTEVKDDPHQFGGDFIIDSSGRLILIFRPKLPSDRPSIDLMLQAVRNDSK